MTDKEERTTPVRVLVVDDEPDIVALVAFHLAKAGFGVSTAANGRDALDAARQNPPAIVVLDLMLPGMSGFEVLEALRSEAQTSQVGVLMLTARREEADRIQGLTLGADDYLTKPFSPQELVLRVQAIVRRMSALPNNPTELLRIGPLTIDRAAHRVMVEEREIELTPIEFKLLLMLVEKRGRVQERTHLLENVWDAASDIQTRTVDMHVQRLRSKLGTAGDLIETVRGFGYRIDAEPARPK